MKIWINPGQLSVAVEVLAKACRPAAGVKALKRPAVEVKPLVITVGIDHWLVACCNDGPDHTGEHIGRKASPEKRAVVSRLLDEPPRSGDQRIRQAQLSCNRQHITVAATSGQQHPQTGSPHLPDRLASGSRHSVLAVRDGAINVKHKQLKCSSHGTGETGKKSGPVVLAGPAMIVPEATDD